MRSEEVVGIHRAIWTRCHPEGTAWVSPKHGTKQLLQSPKTNSSTLKIGKRGRPTLKFPVTETFSLVLFFARHSIDSVTPWQRSWWLKLWRKALHKWFLIHLEVSRSRLWKSTIKLQPTNQDVALNTTRCVPWYFNPSKPKAWFKNSPETWSKQPKKRYETTSEYWCWKQLLLKTRFGGWISWNQEAQIRPFKSYLKNLCQVNSKTKKTNLQVQVLYIAYTAKKQVWEKGIKVPWLSAMEECIIPLQWCC